MGFENNLTHSIIFPLILLCKDRLKTALQGKTILITGASFGIGEALVELLKDTETHLILVARTETKLLEIQRKMQGNSAKITIFAVDLTQTESLVKLIHDLENLHEGVDIIVSNAGKSIRRSIFEAQNRLHDFTRTMALNYNAPVQLVLGLLPILAKKIDKSSMFRRQMCCCYLHRFGLPTKPQKPLLTNFCAAYSPNSPPKTLLRQAFICP